ncbi:MAG: transposase [Elusimicrobia bacterium]|nr:transposase [Elusimicrobiota bacterium]
MPRKPRLDIKGCLYHVIARGNERHRIFRDDADREQFLSRLKLCMAGTDIKCLAWCLMSNHFHLLVLRGERPLSELMRRLMTGYVSYFNRRHTRAGHLFQNRYKSILCDADEYLKELVPYIHLNPVRSNIIKHIRELGGYRWSGHLEVIGRIPATIISRDKLLSYYASNEREALRHYMQLLNDRAAKRIKGVFSGGGLVKSLGGIFEAARQVKRGEAGTSDERILGVGGFVDEVLASAGEKSSRMERWQDILAEVVRKTSIDSKAILSRNQRREVVRARAVFCHLAKERGGVSGEFLAKQTGLTSGAISMLAKRGGALTEL